MVNETQVSQFHVPANFIDLGLGDPQFSLLPLDLIRKAAEDRFSSSDPEYLQYGSSQGDGNFRRSLADFLTRAYGYSVSPETLFISSGASMGLHLVSSLFTKPGDTIFVEEPTYFFALKIFADHALNIIPIRTDENGLQIESLAEQLTRHNPKFFYFIPTFQNPTGSTLSEERRLQLLKLSKEENLLLVADEVYHLLSYYDEPPAPMAKYSATAPLISLGSFSKILAPGLRLGWIQAAPNIIDQLVNSGLLTSGGGMNPFTSAIIDRLIRQGSLEQNIAKLISTYRSRCEAVDSALKEHLVGFDYKKPKGGYFFWLRLPAGMDAARFQQHAREHNVSFRSGALFSSQGGLMNFIRISFVFYEEQGPDPGHSQDQENDLPVVKKLSMGIRSKSECYNPFMHWVFRILRSIEVFFYACILTSILTSSDLRKSTDVIDSARYFTRPYEFDYVTWTIQALAVKLDQAALNVPYYFNEGSRHKIVLDYLHLVDEISANENQLSILYADPNISDPASASVGLRETLSGLYSRQKYLAPLAESVLQAQVTEILAVLDLTFAGQPLPPVLFRMTPLPYNLVISPRARIQQDAAISLISDLNVQQQVYLENEVDSNLGVSSLVVPVGGIGSYPTMVMRINALGWLTDTISHEWIHNWLTLQPLGINYETTPELRTMNETTASIAGQEIAFLVLHRYYPEYAFCETSRSISSSNFPATEQFDFNAEMHLTRVHADDLLAAGRITEAETYMEQRRQFFWQNGYAIRKINQAYFAFYGAYAAIPGGPAGEDPVGPAVRHLRAQSATLTGFLKKIARMNSFQQLQNSLSP